jgi:DNA-binding transcriptional LysR family regulator
VTLDQLRIFIAVAEREHITKAAQAVHRTQSAVSAAIAALEDRHGVKLFDRLGRRIALTSAGRTFLDEARSLVAHSTAAEQALVDLAGLKVGALTLAASQTVGNYWLPQRLQLFARTYPGIAIKLKIGNTEEVVARTVAGEIDLGFVEGAVRNPAIVARALGDDELLIVAPPGTRAPRRPDAKWLTSMPWIARESGSGTREAFEAALQKLGVRVAARRVVLEMPSNESVRAAVEAGAGLAIMSRLVVDAAVRSGALMALSPNLAMRRFWVVRHRQRYLSLAAQALTKIVDQFDDKVSDLPDSGLP